MKSKGNAYFLIIIMVIMLAIIIQALRMEFYTSKLLPLILGTTVFILAAIGLAQEFMAERKPEAPPDTAAPVDVVDKVEPGLRQHLPIASWIFGLALAIYLFGFIITIPVFIIAYMKSQGVRWLITILSAVLMTAFIYGGFAVLLRVELYRGLLFSWLGS